MIKNTLLALFLIVCWLNLANAQSASDPYPAKLDSLQKLLTSQPAADTMQVIRLNHLAQLCFFDMQFERGLKAARQAPVLAKQISYAKSEGLYLQTLGFLAEGSAIQYYYGAKAELFFADRNEKLPPNALSSPEKIDYEKKINQLKAFLKTLNKKEDAEIIGIVLRVICANYRELDRFDESLPYLERSVNTFLGANLPIPAYYLLTFEIEALIDRGRLKEADVVEQRILQFLATHENSRETALIALRMSYTYTLQNKQAQAFSLLIKTGAYLEQMGEHLMWTHVLLRLGTIYNTLGLPGKALDYFKKMVAVHEKEPVFKRSPEIYHNIAFTLILLKRFREAETFVDKARKLIDKQSNVIARKSLLTRNYDAVGQILMGEKNYLKALSIFKKAVDLATETQNKGIVTYLDLYIAQCHQQLGNVNESNQYGLNSYEQASQRNNDDGREVSFKSSRLLYENYKKLNQPLLAYKYLEANDAFQKIIDADNAAYRLADLEISTLAQKSEQEKNRLEQARLLNETENQNQRWWLFTVAAGFFSAIVLLLIVYRSNRHKHKANALLHKQKEEIDRQRGKAENALTELTTTQAQLIQKEKLASLGELTAGIAHEIQNPLNFVNNFSEVSAELIDELKEEALAGHTNDVLAIADDLAENLQKINHHGGRASSIVKSMLEHSRTGTGERESTDLNALADEYLRLAYHGQSGKSQEFDCKLVTDFDPDLGEVNVVPQEIGRVLLNLYNNAFYAVKERWARGDGGGAGLPANCLGEYEAN